MLKRQYLVWVLDTYLGGLSALSLILSSVSRSSLYGIGEVCMYYVLNPGFNTIYAY
jgi:hypothetical protein